MWRAVQISNGGRCPWAPGGWWWVPRGQPVPADLSHTDFSLCGFSLTTLYLHLIPVQAPLAPPCTHGFSFSSAKGQRGQTLQTREVSGVPVALALFPGEARLLHHVLCTDLALLHCCSDKARCWFRRRVFMNVLNFIKIEVKLFLKKKTYFYPFFFFFFGSCHLLFAIKCWGDQ